MKGGGWGVSFSASAGYKKASSTVQSGKYKLIMTTASCKYYFAKLNYLDLPELSPEVIEWIGRMNHSLTTRGVIDDALVYAFVDYFGTHIPSEMVYGARITYENKVTSDRSHDKSSNDISVKVKASYSGLFSMSGGVDMSESQKQEARDFQKKTEITTISIGAPPPKSGRAADWASTVKDTPVPVEFDLIPIYELFDTRKLSLRQYFGLETSRIIRNKILGIASKYCRMLHAQGEDVKCNDDSVITVENYVMVDFNNDVIQDFDFLADECINECMRRKTCVITTVYPDNHSETKMGKRCRLQNHDKDRIKLAFCDGCKTFIDPNGLTSPIGFRKLRYGSAVGRNNKMSVTDSLTYDQLKQFCSVVCSSDPRCTGFEISNQTQFNYNCATYSEHTSNFVNVSDFEFETYIMPDLAKRQLQENLKEQQIMLYGLRIESALSSKISEQKCNLEKCETNSNCLVSSSFSDSNPCINVMNEQNIGTMSVREDDRLHLEIFPERAYPEGWINISLPNSYIRLAPKSSGLSNSTRDNLDLDDCGLLCSSDIFCRFVSWDSNRKCVKFTSASVTISQNIRFLAPYKTNEEPSAINTVLMIPNQNTKMRKLMIAN